MRDYEGPLRQFAVTGLGREQPTLFLTNSFDARPREVLTNYARRNGIEDGLGTNVNFFHMDCLSSEVRLNVDLDLTLTVLAHGCYRWLARQLKGFAQAKPKLLYRKFVETGGRIEVAAGRRLKVTFDRRYPILREAALDHDCPRNLRPRGDRNRGGQPIKFPHRRQTRRIAGRTRFHRVPAP